ncbi:MAG: phosphosulfolactate synthase [Bacteroidales bacterium]|nr:phosphosulfolactate synthase [Bacteroidales bacterium]
MNFELPFVPERPSKPRNEGIAMIMDKGLSLRESENLIASSGHLIDYIKLGFGTSAVTPDVKEKIKLFQDNDIIPYLGGTLFEAFIVRDLRDEYKKVMDQLGLAALEISDGSIVVDHDEKLSWIEEYSKDFTVLSEVGSKQEGIIIAPNKWINMMDTELNAGSTMVIAEARESGNVGIYRPNGNAHVALVNKIVSNIPPEKIMWETPKKSQQAWFIQELGANVNLGNIAPDQVIALETLRLGLRGDTFFQFLPEQMKESSNI